MPLMQVPEVKETIQYEIILHEAAMIDRKTGPNKMGKPPLIRPEPPPTS
jgi:hypothetical protein